MKALEKDACDNDANFVDLQPDVLDDQTVATDEVEAQSLKIQDESPNTELQENTHDDQRNAGNKKSKTENTHNDQRNADNKKSKTAEKAMLTNLQIQPLKIVTDYLDTESTQEFSTVVGTNDRRKPAMKKVNTSVKEKQTEEAKKKFLAPRPLFILLKKSPHTPQIIADITENLDHWHTRHSAFPLAFMNGSGHGSLHMISMLESRDFEYESILEKIQRPDRQERYPLHLLFHSDLLLQHLPPSAHLSFRPSVVFTLFPPKDDDRVTVLSNGKEFKFGSSSKVWIHDDKDKVREITDRSKVEEFIKEHILLVNIEEARELFETLFNNDKYWY